MDKLVARCRVCRQPYLVEADADGFISQRCPVCRSLATRPVLEERLREARREDGVTVGD